MSDNNIGYIDNNLHVFDSNLQQLDFEWRDNCVADNSVDLGSWSHYMQKEIYEIPNSLRATFDMLRRTNFNLPKQIDNVLIIGCGTSYHSGLLGCKYIEAIAGIPSECILASEFIYNNYIVKPNTLGVFISQSGETADTLAALKRAKSLGIFVLSITNVPDSSITRLSDSVLYLNVGAEICVASTKAYTSQVLELLLLSNILINNARGKYIDSGHSLTHLKADKSFAGDCVVVDWDNTINYLGISYGDWKRLFELDIANIDEFILPIINEIAVCKELHLIGKDYDFITAQEGALKIKEVSYIFTDAYPCGELKHGTLSLIEEGSVVLSVLTQSGIILDKSKNAVHEIRARGGKCIVFSQFDEGKCGVCDARVKLPNLHDLLMPIVSIIPIDLIAYRVSIIRGINPDKPRNLAKSVTVE